MSARDVVIVMCSKRVKYIFGSVGPLYIRYLNLFCLPSAIQPTHNITFKHKTPSSVHWTRLAMMTKPEMAQRNAMLQHQLNANCTFVFQQGCFVGTQAQLCQTAASLKRYEVGFFNIASGLASPRSQTEMGGGHKMKTCVKVTHHCP